MEFQDIVRELQNTSRFNAWHAKHPDSFLAHIFVMQDDANKGLYHVGYFANNAITTFIVGRGNVEVIEDQEVAKPVERLIDPLDITLVKVSSKEILDASEKIRKEHYTKLLIMKSFFIVQSLEGTQIFNVTYMTQDFKTINIHLDMDLTLRSHDCRSLAEFVKGKSD